MVKSVVFTLALLQDEFVCVSLHRLLKEIIHLPLKDRIKIKLNNKGLIKVFSSEGKKGRFFT